MKGAHATAYNFDESERNALGFQLLHANHRKNAIRIFRLNVEAYPQSGDVYDSLGEAYMNDGNKPQASTNYERSVQFNPKNFGAVKMVAKLKAP